MFRTLNSHWREVLWAFLRLGLTSFGGPIAHLGYFRGELVQRRQWLEEAAYADLVALCQFLPGPASSQVAFALGLRRAGWRGGIAAWVGFTLPSAILLVVFAFEARHLPVVLQHGLIHGLELVALAVVAQAVVGMAQTLCPDRVRAAIAATALVILAAQQSSLAQIAAILIGAGLGFLFCHTSSASSQLQDAVTVSPRLGLASIGTVLVLLLVLPYAAALWSSPTLQFFDAFFRSGALVFGGGHVVLPLLQDAVVAPGWVPADVFFAGYGAAQAVPGPLFTFAAYLGAVSSFGPHGLWGAWLALIAIFLPGLMLLVGALPYWQALKRWPAARAATSGMNAAVVGMLASAFFNPRWIATVASPADLAAVLFAFVLLTVAKTPPIVVVVLGVAWGIAPTLMS
jgi:chromate transporter